MALGTEGEDRPPRSLPENAVAHLEYDNASDRYRVRFRYGGKGYKRSLKMADEGEAKSVLAFNEANGALLWNSGTQMKDPTTAPLTVANGQVFVQSGKKLYVWGL